MFPSSTSPIGAVSGTMPGATGNDQRPPVPESRLRWTRLSDGMRPYVCLADGCGRRFAHIRQILGHLRGHSPGGPLVCPHEGCGKSFSRSRELSYHRRTHTGEKPLACPVENCTRRFIWPTSLNVHALTHSGDRLFGCSFEGCNRTFALQQTARAHRQTHERDRAHTPSARRPQSRFPDPRTRPHPQQSHQRQNPAAADGPPQTVPGPGPVEEDTGRRAPGSLRAPHRPRHGEAGTWSCPAEGCGKRFLRRSGLRTHQKAHRRSLIWACPADDCTQHFPRKTALHEHLKSHAGERIWPCPVEGCDRRFIQRGHLTSHQQSHNKPAGRYVCPAAGCYRTFSRQTWYNIHVRQHQPTPPGLSELARSQPQPAAPLLPPGGPDHPASIPLPPSVLQPVAQALICADPSGALVVCPLAGVPVLSPDDQYPVPPWPCVQTHSPWPQWPLAQQPPYAAAMVSQAALPEDRFRPEAARFPAVPRSLPLQAAQPSGPPVQEPSPGIVLSPPVMTPGTITRAFPLPPLPNDVLHWLAQQPVSTQSNGHRIPLVIPDQTLDQWLQSYLPLPASAVSRCDLPPDRSS